MSLCSAGFFDLRRDYCALYMSALFFVSTKDAELCVFLRGSIADLQRVIHLYHQKVKESPWRQMHNQDMYSRLKVPHAHCVGE